MLSWTELLNEKPTFDMKLKNYKEKETIREKGTKKFQKRVAEEQEAEEEIQQFDLDKEENKNDDNTPTIQELIR